jgi:hypothetical protein
MPMNEERGSGEPLTGRRRSSTDPHQPVMPGVKQRPHEPGVTQPNAGALCGMARWNSQGGEAGSGMANAGVKGWYRTRQQGRRRW